MFDDHLVDHALPRRMRVLVVQVHFQATVLAPHRGQPLVERHADVVLGEHLEIPG